MTGTDFKALNRPKGAQLRKIGCAFHGASKQAHQLTPFLNFTYFKKCFLYCCKAKQVIFLGVRYGDWESILKLATGHQLGRFSGRWLSLGASKEARLSWESRTWFTCKYC